MSKTKLYKEHEQAVDYFSHLPDEILYKMVSILPPFDLCTLAKVNQRFQEMCSDKRLWKILSLARQTITSSKMEMLLTSSFPIEELDLSYSWILLAQDHQKTMSSDFHMTLEKLDLTMYGYGSDRRLDISSNLPYILERCRTKKLILDNLTVSPRSGLMEAIAKHVNLEVLSIERTYFRGVSVDDIRKLFNGCNRLKELTLTGGMLSTKQLRVFCDRIPETVEKLVLPKASAQSPGQEFWRRMNDDAYDPIIERNNSLAESYGILFRRAKKMKYFGAPFTDVALPAIMNQMIQHHSLETLRLSIDHDLDDDFPLPDPVSVLEKLPPKLNKIEFISTGWIFSEIQRSSILDQLEEFRKTVIGIDVEVHEDLKYSSVFF